MTRLFIKDISLIVTMDSADNELRDHHILIEDKAIKAIGTDLEAPPDARIIDGNGKVALPGFVNTSFCGLEILFVIAYLSNKDFFLQL